MSTVNEDDDGWTEEERMLLAWEAAESLDKQERIPDEPIYSIDPTDRNQSS